MDLFMDIPVGAYERFFEAHCIAPIVITKTLLPAMLDRGEGQVLTVTSGAAFATPPGPAGKGGWGLAYAAGKASGHPLALHVHGEFSGQGIRALNVEPGFVATERIVMTADDVGQDVSRAAPPEAIGATLAWLIVNPEGRRLRGTTVQAQHLCLEHGLYPDWR
jgi:NAD(P)-dependent dehydrogenase (short-subunit alcohol dehydrogenase family)